MLGLKRNFVIFWSKIYITCTLLFVFYANPLFGVRDYYEVLGVARTADAKEIKKAYKKIAIANHPDRTNHDPVATERFKEADEAYDVLGDPDKRKQYDRYGPTKRGFPFSTEREETEEERKQRRSDLGQKYGIFDHDEGFDILHEGSANTYFRKHKNYDNFERKHGRYGATFEYVTPTHIRELVTGIDFHYDPKSDEFTGVSEKGKTFYFNPDYQGGVIFDPIRMRGFIYASALDAWLRCELKGGSPITGRKSPGPKVKEIFDSFPHPVVEPLQKAQETESLTRSRWYFVEGWLATGAATEYNHLTDWSHRPLPPHREPDVIAAGLASKQSLEFLEFIARMLDVEWLDGKQFTKEAKLKRLGIAKFYEPGVATPVSCSSLLYNTGKLSKAD